MAETRNTKLRVVKGKGTQHATFRGIDATSCATREAQGSLKTAAVRVLARNTGCNRRATGAWSCATSDATMSIEKSGILNRQNIDGVLAALSDIGLFRDGSRLRWRNEPTEQQVKLLVKYREILLDRLKPRIL